MFKIGLVVSIFLCFGYAAQGQGLKDVQIIPPGNYSVQPSQLTPNDSPYRQRVLGNPFHASGERQIYPAAMATMTSVLATQCPTHVHNFYYSGKSSFQCPIIAGGRTRIVTVHPKTGEPVEFFAMLAPGAPRVEYYDDRFVYVYKDHRTVIGFPTTICNHSRVTVDQKNGVRLSDRANSFIAKVKSIHQDKLNTNTAQAAKDLAKSTYDSIKGADVLVDRGVGGTLDTLSRATDLLPGKSYLQSLGNQKPLDARDSSIRDAQRSNQGSRRFIRWPN